MLRPLIVIGALLMLATSAHSADDCQTESEIRAIFAGQYQGPRLMSMSPAMTGVFVKAWNAYPPESGIKADTGLIIDYPQFKRLQVVLFSNGCRVEIPTPTRWLFLKLMKDWHGEPQENET